MSRTLLGATLLSMVLALGNGALAATDEEIAKCFTEVDELTEKLDGASIGEKEADEVIQLVESSTGLCEEGKIAEAEEALGKARALLESGAGGGAPQTGEKKPQ